MRVSLLLILILFCCSSLRGQDVQSREVAETYRQTYIVTVKGDTIPYFQLPQITVFGDRRFKNDKEWKEYTKLVRDVKRAYPYAKLVSASIIETYEYMQTLPDEKARQKHLEEVQKYMMDRYKPELKKMSRNQGKILVKLIDRQTNSSSYEIVKALLGTIKAGVYNVFAGLFGNNLKTRYDPTKGEDMLIEEIVLQIEQGTVDQYYRQDMYRYQRQAYK